MRYVAAYNLTILLSLAGGLFFPWWIIAVAAFVVAVAIPQRPAGALTTGMLAVASLWSTMALIIDAQNHSILSVRIASVLPLGGSTAYLILATALLGGIVAGMAALSGNMFRRLFVKKQSSTGAVVSVPGHQQATISE